MANSTGGSIESVTIKGRTFSVAADSDGNVKRGGKENEIQPNGDGTGRIIQTRVPWIIADVNLAVDDQADDHDFLQDVSDAGEFVAITIAYASGVVDQGQGLVTAEVQKSTQSQTVSCSLSGTGKLSTQ